MSNPEPWLRGPLPGVSPLVLPVLQSFTQVREDLQKYAAELDPSEVWCIVNGGCIGFHMKHIAGSVERLTTYLMGGQLKEGQIQAVHAEYSGDEDGATLLALIDSALSASEHKLRTIAPESLYDGRLVGRRRLPTTVLGLLVHLAEHTQRHLGQIITLSKIVRQSS